MLFICKCNFVLPEIIKFLLCIDFVNALEKKSGITAQYKERTANLKADVLHLEVIISKQWSTDDELKQLKSDLVALNRKSTAELVPKHDEKTAMKSSVMNSLNLSEWRFQLNPQAQRSQWRQNP